MVCPLFLRFQQLPCMLIAHVNPADANVMNTNTTVVQMAFGPELVWLILLEWGGWARGLLSEVSRYLHKGDI